MFSRTFNPHDQHEFAALSGDYNPIHLNELEARRLLFGERIVHGAHLVLWALLSEMHRSSVGPQSIHSLKASFLRHVPLNESVECNCSSSEGISRFEVFVQNRVALRLEVQWKPSSISPSDVEDALPPHEQPADVAVDDIPVLFGQLPLYASRAHLDRLFPAWAQRLALQDIGTLLAITRVVGNKCPGLNSVLSSIRIEAAGGTDTCDLSYRVAEYDSRFRRCRISFEGANHNGHIDAFVRPAPTDQVAYRYLRDVVPNKEFGNLTALVVGGSRGLGEVAAKLLCAGGAAVTVTYFRGQLDAEKLVGEVRSAGGIIDAIALDITQPLPEFITTPDILVYCSTPFIFGAVKGEFNIGNFNKFCAHYVDGFNRLCTTLINQGTRRILYPSSIAIDQMPDNMGEYAAAKSAGEALCIYLEKRHKGLRINRPRFPRLSTDQTGSIMPVRNEDPVPIVLTELRSLMA